ncbi:MAG: type VI secretion system lipoprotein TssJ [Rhodospirillales bacterium]|nr:type VI secretion system lipoprotein TssJ [Rhodospirillales bacterium]MDE2197712.1 type VI secretion system lipoprotein TssJ [Rhodospirillales bacterium]
MISRRHLLTLPAILAVPAALASCASPPPPPATLNLTLVGGADQNPDAVGKPASVAVKMFQLAASGKFERADVFAIIEHEKDTLGTDDLASEEFVIAPGETRKITRELKKGTQMIGLIVLFRDIDHATWRVMHAAPSSGPFDLTLKTAGIKAMLA